MLSPFTLLFIILASAGARVTFPYSEVLQANDLIDSKADFKCADGCKVFVETKDESLYISQNGVFITNFKDIVGTELFAPAGRELQAGNGYALHSRSQPVPNFVFYVVSKKASHYGTTVLAPQEPMGVVANSRARYTTFISRSNALWFNGFSGTFPAGYPRIFTTGHDAVDDERCSPVYQARSQYNADQTLLTLFAPIFTVDFGFEGEKVGDHSVMASQKDGSSIFASPNSSTVYMSPGYVGCSFPERPAYYSAVTGVQDQFKIAATSLDIYAVYDDVWPDEPVRFHVNEDTLDFYYFGASNFTRHYPEGDFNIQLAWTRSNPESSWAIQLDFGTVPDLDLTTPNTASTGTTTRAQSTTTTSSGRSVTLHSVITFVALSALACI